MDKIENAVMIFAVYYGLLCAFGTMFMALFGWFLPITPEQKTLLIIIPLVSWWVPGMVLSLISYLRRGKWLF